MDKRKLQRLIDKAAKTGGAAFEAQNALNEYCEEQYGHTPSEIDADEILDAVYMLCGWPQTMDAARFDEIMRGDDD